MSIGSKVRRLSSIRFRAITVVQFLSQWYYIKLISNNVRDRRAKKVASFIRSLNAPLGLESSAWNRLCSFES
jgi:hypothetical protein